MDALQNLVTTKAPLHIFPLEDHRPFLVPAQWNMANRLSVENPLAIREVQQSKLVDHLPSPSVFLSNTTLIPLSSQQRVMMIILRLLILCQMVSPRVQKKARSPRTILIQHDLFWD